MPTNYRKPVKFNATASLGTTDIASLAISTTFTPPAQSISLGTGGHLSTSSKLDGVYMSGFLSGATSVLLTHGLAYVTGWWVVQKNASIAIWCSDITATTTATGITFTGAGTCTFKVFIF